MREVDINMYYFSLDIHRGASQLACARILAQCILTVGSFWLADILFEYFFGMIWLLWHVTCFDFHFRIWFSDLKGECLTWVILKSEDLRLDAYEPISFKLVIMIDMTKLYILIPVGITLTFTQGHSVMRNLQLNNNNNDFISIALFHVKHAQLRWTMPMNNNNTHTHTLAHTCIINNWRKKNSI